MGNGSWVCLLCGDVYLSSRGHDLLMCVTVCEQRLINYTGNINAPYYGDANTMGQAYEPAATNLGAQPAQASATAKTRTPYDTKSKWYTTIYEPYGHNPGLMKKEKPDWFESPDTGLCHGYHDLEVEGRQPCNCKLPTAKRD